MPLTIRETQSICKLVVDLCGIELDSQKDYLIENRLSAILEETGLPSYAKLAEEAQRGNGVLQGKIVDAITTNETLFFRDGAPFQAFQAKVIPDLIDEKSTTAFPKRIRIWSLACSSGQEPYSLAMKLFQLIPDVENWDINILASDISRAAIGKASKGVYDSYEVRRGVPDFMLTKYFVPQDNNWRIRDEVRALVTFEQRNLINDFGSTGPFDVIFCRNVANYFSEDVRRKLFLRLHQQLNPGGYLFVGSTESLSHLSEQFEPHYHCNTVFYRSLPAMTKP